MTLLPLTPSLAETLPPGFPVRQGPLVFTLAANLAREDIAPAELEWFCRFRLIVTNGYDFPAPRVLAALRAHDCKLFHYFWANGFTEKELQSTSLPDPDWRPRLLREHPEWLLSPEPMPGPPGTPPSYYFDFADLGLRGFLAEVLRDLRRRGGQVGIFFDYAGAYALPQAVAELWQRRHPDLPYDQALADFFRAVRSADPEGLVFTNQAVLGDRGLLPTVDYDMVESYGTSFLWGPVAKVGGENFPLSFRRPWDGPGSLQTIYTPILERLRTGPPRGELVCLDYMRPALSHTPVGELSRARSSGSGDPSHQESDWHQTVDLEAVYYSYCAAALWGLDAYCSGWYGQEYRGPLYFADLGKPLGEGPVETGGLVLREYERGLIALSAKPEPAQVTWRLQANDRKRLHNLLTGRKLAVREGKVTLRLRPTQAPGAGVLQPVGRVYLRTD